MEPTTTQTIYSGSANCPTCGTILTPLEVSFGGPTKQCAECRTQMYSKLAKQAMTKDSRQR